ncbi:MAG: deoxyribonuclease IV [Candidatus Eremiobacteraeota bacterium]|nr:deoxyribonuclease IV [Candidatus Eremiobacteraeota bacterium]
MRLGIHVHVRGGYVAAIEHAARIGAQAVQIFSSTPRSYRVAPPDEQALTNFRQLRDDAGIAPTIIHSSYLINLASEDPKIVAGSLRLLQHDLNVAAAGGIRYVNTHLGSYGSRARTEGFSAACTALQRVLEEIPRDVFLLMENSAGAGQLCGGTLEELGRFIHGVDHPQLGVCLDTAHAWAAGYEINSQRGVDDFLYEAAEQIGLDRLHLFHLNDTQVELGANRDRHWHIAEGNIGFAGFRALAARPELKDKTGILETPGDVADDERNMRMIQMIFSGASP